MTLYPFHVFMANKYLSVIFTSRFIDFGNYFNRKEQKCYSQLFFRFFFFFFKWHLLFQQTKKRRRKREAKRKIEIAQERKSLKQWIVEVLVRMAKRIRTSCFVDSSFLLLALLNKRKRSDSMSIRNILPLKCCCHMLFNNLFLKHKFKDHWKYATFKRL